MADDSKASSEAPALSQCQAEEMEDVANAMIFCSPLGVDQAPPPPPPPVVHAERCPCGCVPAVLSLFEMAELRKQAKLKSAAEKKAAPC
jgi:hypothetical protein